MNRLTFLSLICLLLHSATSEVADTKDNDLQVTGRGIRDMARSIWDFFFGSDDDYDYDYEFNPNEVSSYTSYDPNSPRRDSLDYDEEEYSWGDVALGAVLTVAPIALLAAALPSGLFTIAVKKRSFGDDNILDRLDPTELPLLRSLQEGDLLSLSRPQCQRKLFCELSQLGKNDSASLLQKTFYYVSYLMPDNMSRRFRLQRLFEATRANECEKFTCHNTHTPKTLKDSPSNHLQVPSESKDSEQ